MTRAAGPAVNSEEPVHRTEAAGTPVVAKISNVLMAALAVALVAGAAALAHFWPAEGLARTQAVFAFVEFVVALAIALLAIICVRAVGQFLAAQNRAPEIRVRTQGVHVSPARVEFAAAIGNASTRATNVTIRRIQVAGVQALTADFYHQGAVRASITIPAAGCEEVIVRANFKSAPFQVGKETQAALIFEDLYTGELPEISCTV